ncbi:MAG: hypothetical protein IKJ60_09775 [Ruminococcus sp.]|nr:hypothetical protein [Ruminococcus sp.]
MQFKRLLSLTMAACFTLAGCSETKENSTNDSSSQTEIAEQLDTTQPADDDPLTAQVKVEKLDLGVTDVGMSEFFHTENGYGMFVFPQTSYDAVFAEYSKDFKLVSENKLTLPAPQDDYYYTGGLYVYAENKLYSLATMEWHNGMKPYVYSDNQEDFDWETYNSEMKLRYMFCTYSTDGTLIDAVALEDLSDNFDTYLLPKQFYIDNGEAYITLDSGSILRINKKDGSADEIYNLADKYKGSYGCDLQLFKDRDGKTLLFTAFHDSSSEDLSYKVSVDEFDLQTGKASENIYTPQADLNDDSEVNFVSGYGDYRFCLVNDENITGYKYDGSEEVLLEWEKSDLQTSPVQLLGDNCMIYRSYGESGTVINKLTRKRKSELNEKQVFEVMVLSSNTDFTEIVNAFNRSQSDFRIETEILTVDAENSEEYEKAMEQAKKEFQMNLLTDDAPDIIVTSDFEDIFNYGKKGALADLYPIMENDTEMNESAFLPNILKCAESDNGELYGMPIHFKVETVLVKTKICDKENWTMEDMISVYDNAEKDVYKWTNRREMLRTFLCGMDFVDEKKGTCSFNSDEFIELLKFCKRFPSEQEMVHDGDKVLTPEEEAKLNEYFANRISRYINDDDIAKTITISSPNVGMFFEKGEMTEEAVTFVGYPSNDGNGTKLTLLDNISITSKCENKEFAWEFIKHCFDYSTSLPVTEKEFKEAVDGWTELKGAFGASGLGYYEEPRTGIKMYPMTEEEKENIERIIRNASTLSSPAYSTLNDIIFEEAEAFFADAKTAEETAEIIQNRVEIFVSEKSW